MPSSGSRPAPCSRRRDSSSSARRPTASRRSPRQGGCGPRSCCSTCSCPASTASRSPRGSPPAPDPPAVVLISSRGASTYGPRLAAARALGFIAKRDLSGREPRERRRVSRAAPAVARRHRARAARRVGVGRPRLRPRGDPGPRHRVDAARVRPGRVVAPAGQPHRAAAGRDGRAVVRRQLRDGRALAVPRPARPPAAHVSGRARPLARRTTRGGRRLRGRRGPLGVGSGAGGAGALGRAARRRGRWPPPRRRGVAAGARPVARRHRGARGRDRRRGGRTAAVPGRRGGRARPARDAVGAVRRGDRARRRGGHASGGSARR